jgi:PAS domain S-box-containing protein
MTTSSDGNDGSGEQVTNNGHPQSSQAIATKLVEQAHDAILATDKQHKIIFWNKGAEKLFGLQTNEVLGKLAADLKFTNFTAEQVTELYYQIDKLGTWQFEHLYTHKDGQKFYGVTNGTLLKDANDDMLGYGFIVKDITFRKRLEEELGLYSHTLEADLEATAAQTLRNERKFRTILNSLHEAIVLLDHDFKVIYRSLAGQSISGWSQQDVTEKSALEMIHPDDLVNVQKTLGEAIKYPGKPFHSRFRTFSNKKQVLWIEATTTNLLEDENVCAILMVTKDVTARVEADTRLVQSELRFRSLIEHTQDGITLFDANLQSLFRSKSAERITRKFADVEIGAFAIPADAERLKSILSECKLRPSLPIYFHQHAVLPSGEHVAIEGTFTNLLRLDGVNAIVCNFQELVKARANKRNNGEQSSRESAA